MESSTSLNKSLENIFEEIAKETPDQNVFVSPISIALAFGMLAEGAKGQTLLKIVKMYGRRTSNGISCNTINEIFNMIDANKGVTLNIANSVWSNKSTGIKLSEPFITAIKHKFRGTAQEILPSEGATVINKWIEKQTNNLIKNCLSDVPNDFLMILVNAIYFKGSWVKAFPKQDTMKKDFNLFSGQKVETDFMVRKDDFGYFVDEQGSYVAVPYKDSKIKFVIGLPNAADANGLSSISSDGATKAASGSKKKIRLKIPKFKIEYKINLGKFLNKMGLGSLFSPNPDLSKIAGTNDAFISQVFHQTFVQVDEEGTEAAAVTGMICRITSVPAPPLNFVADRPFKYYIMDEDTKIILFAGVFYSPPK